MAITKLSVRLSLLYKRQVNFKLKKQQENMFPAVFAISYSGKDYVLCRGNSGKGNCVWDKAIEASFLP